MHNLTKVSNAINGIAIFCGAKSYKFCYLGEVGVNRPNEHDATHAKGTQYPLVIMEPSVKVTNETTRQGQKRYTCDIIALAPRYRTNDGQNITLDTDVDTLSKLGLILNKILECLKQSAVINYQSGDTVTMVTDVNVTADNLAMVKMTVPIIVSIDCDLIDSRNNDIQQAIRDIFHAAISSTLDTEAIRPLH